MHPEAITSEQTRIFERLKNFSEYCLAGGTALALQIGHRVSVDFDFFSDKEIPLALLQKIKTIFKDYQREVVINNSGQLTVSLNGIHLTFVKYPFPRIFKLVGWRGVKMLSVPEIAATKAYVLGRRAAMKDYADLYFILEEKHLSLRKLIDICQRKYRAEFEPRLFLEELIFMEDVGEEKMLFLKKSAGKREMVSFFEKEIKKLKF